MEVKNVDILAVYFENLTILKIPSLLSSVHEMVASSYKMIFNIDRIWKIKVYKSMNMHYECKLLYFPGKSR